MPGQQRGHRNNVSPKKQVMRTVCVCNLPHSVAKPACTEVADGSTSKAFSPGTVTALWLLFYPFPTSQTEPNGWQTQSLAFWEGAPSFLPEGVLQPVLHVCDKGLIALSA